MVHTFQGTQNAVLGETRVLGTSKYVTIGEKEETYNFDCFFVIFCAMFILHFEYIAPPQCTKRSLKLNSTRNFGRKRMHTRLLRLLVSKKSKRKIEKKSQISGTETNVSGTDVCLWHRRLSLAQRQMSLGQSCR